MAEPAEASRPATVEDIHEIARAMPGVILGGARGRSAPTVYQVSRRSFLFFRNPRPDAVDPDTGERNADVIVFWVESELEKEAILSDASLPFFHDAALRRPSVRAAARVAGQRDEPGGAGRLRRRRVAVPCRSRAVAKWMKTSISHP